MSYTQLEARVRKLEETVPKLTENYYGLFDLQQETHKGVSTVGAKVAALHDEFTEFREETGRRFDAMDAKMDRGFAAMDAKMDRGFAAADERMNQLNSKIDNVQAELGGKIDLILAHLNIG